MRKTLLPTVVLLLAVLAPTAAQQGSGGAAPAPAFRVAHYDVTADVVPSERSLESRAGVTIESLAPGLRTIRLYLHNELVVKQVVEGERILTFSRPADPGDKLMYSPTAAPLDIDLGREMGRGDRATIRVDYGGKISGIVNDVNLISPALTELSSYAAWYPIEKENGHFTYELRLTLPADHAVAVTDAREVSAVSSGAKVVRAFARNDAGADIPLVTGAGLQLRERRVGTTVARVVFRELAEAEALASLDGAVHAVQVMSRLFGPPTASGGITVVFSPRAGFGYSRVPLIVGPEAAAASLLKNPSGRFENFRGLAHEAAHFWWNLAATSTADDWLNEALAEYFALRSVEGELDDESILSAWQRQMFAANGIPPDQTIVGSLRNAPGAYALYYQKGSLIFRTLETRMGRAALDDMLARFYRHYRGRRDVTTAMFLATVREKVGPQLDAFFDRMLLRGGLPGARLSWSAGPRRATGTITLDDAALVGCPLTILLTDRSGAQQSRTTVTLAAGETAWSVSLPFDPADALIDPEWRVLRADDELQYFQRLLPLVHGPFMDGLPELLVPKANIDKARAVIDEWGAAAPGGPTLEYERGWLAFIDGRLNDAVRHLTAALEKPQRLLIPKSQEPGAFSLLGRTFDALGQREQALSFYRKGLELARALALPPVVQVMLFHNYLDVPYPRGRSLHFAARIGHLPLMGEIVAASPDAINAKDPYAGLTPIIWSIQARVRRPVIEWLVDHGADLNATDETGRSLLALVQARGEAEVADYLVAHGAK